MPKGHAHIGEYLVEHATPVQGTYPTGGGGGGIGLHNVGGALSRVMDVLSRANYAVAEGARRSLFTSKGNPDKINWVGSPSGFFEGAWEGLQGKKKTSWDDVLKQGGMPGGWQRSALGLAGDVGLDPTTYIGVGLAKDAALSGAKVAEKVIEKGVEKTAAKVVEKGVAKKLLESSGMKLAAEQSEPLTAKIMAATGRVPGKKAVEDLAKAATKAEPAAVRLAEHTAPKVAEHAAAPVVEHLAPAIAEHAPSAGRMLKQTAKSAAIRGGVGGGLGAGLTAAQGGSPTDILKGAAIGGGFGAGSSVLHGLHGLAGDRTAIQDAAKGLPGGPTESRLELKVAGKPVISSAKGAAALEKIGNPLRASRPGQFISETFNTAHGQTRPIHELERQYVGQGRANVAEKVAEITPVFHGVSHEEDKVIRTAVNEHSVEALPEKLRPAGREMQTQLRAISATDEEIAKLEHRLGMAQKRVDVARKDTTKAKHGETAANISGKIENLATFKDYYPYKGAKKPIERASQNMMMQYEEHARKKAYADFLDEVTRRYPDAAPEIRAKADRINEVFGIKGENTAHWQHDFDAMQGAWKRWVTAYRPGFHIRNMLGDGFNNFLAGVDASAYTKSGKILKHAGDDVKLTLGRGQQFTTAEIDRLYRKAGLESSFLRSDEVTRPVGGISTKIMAAADMREKFGRMANFVDSFDKGLKKGFSVEKAMEEAGARVRKYNFDYADLTPAERNIRRAIPFYTWTRKELPVILQHTLSSPGKILAVPKGTRALEGILGIEHDPNNPFPGMPDGVPDWLQDQSIVQLGGGKSAAPGMPTDLLSMLSPKDFVTKQVESVTPFIKAPIELASGKSLPKGYPQKQSTARYVASQVAGPASTLVRDSPASIGERLINILTGAGIHSSSKKK